MKVLLKIIFLVFGIMLTISSCDKKNGATIIPSTDLSLNIMVTNDSTLCVDTLIYLALANKEKLNNEFEKLIVNELKVDTVSGKRYYYLKLVTEKNDTVAIICDYWDHNNGVYNLTMDGERKTFICTCEGEGCEVAKDIETGEVFCTYNGSRQFGEFNCTLNCEEKKFKNTLELDRGVSIFNDLLFYSPLSITY